MSILQKKTIKLNDIEVIRLEDCQEHFELFKEICLKTIFALRKRAIMN